MFCKRINDTLTYFIAPCAIDNIVIDEYNNYDIEKGDYVVFTGNEDDAIEVLSEENFNKKYKIIPTDAAYSASPAWTYTSPNINATGMITSPPLVTPSIFELGPYRMYPGGNDSS
jgi:hypothetical protein